MDSYYEGVAGVRFDDSLFRARASAMSRKKVQMSEPTKWISAGPGCRRIQALAVIDFREMASVNSVEDGWLSCWIACSSLTSTYTCFLVAFSFSRPLERGTKKRVHLGSTIAQECAGRIRFPRHWCPFFLTAPRSSFSVSPAQHDLRLVPQLSGLHFNLVCGYREATIRMSRPLMSIQGSWT